MKQLTFPYRLTPRGWRTPTVERDSHAPERPTGHALIKVMAVLTLAFVSVIALTRIVMVGADPDGFVSALTPYQSIQPGITVADSQAFGCGTHYFYHETREERCDLIRVGGKLQRVTLTFQLGRVSKVKFVGSGIQVADAVQLWGRPDSIDRNDGLFTLRWESGILAYAQGVNLFDFRLPLQLVVLT